MKPGKPLQRRTPLRSTTPLRRSGRLSFRSAKQTAKYAERRAVIAAMTNGEPPLCAVPGCNRWANDAHEPLTRARGGSITDPANIVFICREHHDELTFTEPAWGYEMKLLRHSWERTA